MNLRDYQVAASNAVFREWSKLSSTLGVCFTGGGKSVMIAGIIRRIQPMRALVIAHRGEILWQIKKAVEDVGLTCEVEKADLEVSNELFGKAQVVVAMVQTMNANRDSWAQGLKRMSKFNPQEFGVLILDEAHHGVANQWKNIICYFKQNPDIRIFGCTATPDRMDEMALRQIFDSVAFDYDILYGVDNGWLVPIEEQMVTIAGLDFSHMRTTAGDLNGADLAAAMEAERNLQGMAGATLDIVGSHKRTLAFAATVKQAEMLTDIFNRHRQGSAAVVHGKTPAEVRKQMFKQFYDGQFQILCNVGVATEGVDIPGVEVVAMGRPTKSRSLFAQMLGRGTRPLPGVVDGPTTPQERKGAILASGKPNLLVIDFTGNAGRHKLICTADILGGKHDEKVIERAIKKMQRLGKPCRVSAVIEEEEKLTQKEIEAARSREAARKAKLVAKVSYHKQQVDPFDLFGMRPAKQQQWHDGKALSEAQRNVLKRGGINPDAYPYAQAQQLVVELIKRWRNKECSVRQAAILKKRGLPTNVSYKEASKLITEIAAKEGWQKRQPVAA